MGKIIGIDLGTTNSEVAVMEGDSPRAITSAEGNVFIPSVVAFTDDGERLVGDPAKRQSVTNPERTIQEIKRRMGEDYKVTIEDRTYTPEQISAMILQKIKADAEDYLGAEVDRAVITVPAYFDDNQRKATQDAGRIAGLEVERLLNEPTAAAFAYGLDKEQDATIAVWDLGGGTFDITIMEVGADEEGSVYEVLATNGDTHLGGKDIDEAVAERLREVFEDEHGVGLEGEREPLQRIREAAEEAKIELSSTKTSRINLPYLMADEDGPKHLEYEMTRAELENLARPILDRAREPCQQAMEDAGVRAGEIDHVILVGGTSRMPLCREIVEEIFGQRPERGVDPLEAVAKGAAIQAGILAGDVEQDMVLLDVTPLTLGVEVQGGMVEPLIERNTTIPTKATKTFTTAQDNQTAVTVHVLQGERPMAADNTSLGNFNLQGIPPAPRGVPQIEVTFDIDADGILNVSAEEQQSGKNNEIEISGAANLSDDEIERMQEEAKRHAEEDERRRELAEALNDAENAVYSAERTLDEFEDEIDDELRETIETKKSEVEELLDDEDLDEPGPLRERKDALLDELQNVGAKMYGQEGQPGQGGVGPGAGGQPGQGGVGPGAGGQPGAGAGPQPGADDDATEVDYEVKDDEDED